MSRCFSSTYALRASHTMSSGFCISTFFHSYVYLYIRWGGEVLGGGDTWKMRYFYYLQLGQCTRGLPRPRGPLNYSKCSVRFCGILFLFSIFTQITLINIYRFRGLFFWTGRVGFTFYLQLGQCTRDPRPRRPVYYSKCRVYEF